MKKTILAAVLYFVCGCCFALTVTPISGSGQSVGRGTALAQPLVGIARDEAGAPIRSTTVDITSVASNGKTWLETHWLATDSQGVFAIDGIAVGPEADVEVVATVRTASGTASGSFVVRVMDQPPPRSIEVVSRAHQYTEYGGNPVPLVIKVLDADGRIVPRAALWILPVAHEPFSCPDGPVLDVFPGIVVADEHGLVTMHPHAVFGPVKWSLAIRGFETSTLATIPMNTLPTTPLQCKPLPGPALPSAPSAILSPVAGSVSIVGKGTAPLGVRLLDVNGLPVPGEKIRFASDEASLVLSPAEVLTDRDGYAYAGVHGGAAAGTHLVSAHWRDRVATTKVVQTAAAPAVQDLWWAGELESGWGISIVQHGETLFSVLYIYDDTAHTTWLVMPGGTWNEDRTVYTGKLYRPRGTPFWIYEAPRLEVGDPIGDMTLTFHSPGQATMSYTIDGTRGSKSIVRQPFGVPEAPRHPGATDMWWGGAAENGWGVAVMQQNATLFMIWFTYDARNQPAWWVMPGGRWTDANTYEGRIHRPFGSAWLDRVFDSGRIQAPDLGPFRLRFESDDRLTLEYSILGRSGQLNLTRQPF